MNYIELLKHSSKKFNSIVCLGLDPIIEDIPEKGNPGSIINIFYEKILNKIIQKKIFPGAVKPNYAFYAQYGIDGILALVNIIKIFKAEGIPIILDVKRGDIGKTAQAYAKEAFDFFKADAVTLSPFLGYDSIGPFIENYPKTGAYILTKTSNASSSEIQNILINDGNPLYMVIADKIVKWFKPDAGSIGSVVGATYPSELDQIASIYINSKKDIPLLIPGVGSQGGELESVMKILCRYTDITIHRINSSSAINYAYKKYPSLDYSEAAVVALRELNNEISSLMETI
jgi:orotidine-5'-phosphate decarboxylase